MNPDDYEEYSLLNHEGRRLANSTSAMEIVRASRWSRFKAAIVADIPDDMAGCGDCKEGECSQARFATCPQRLIAIDEQKARRWADGNQESRSIQALVRPAYRLQRRVGGSHSRI